ncbi:hypothetical protein PAE9249_03488 [Paenibacillus sp. CECT 9249]|uniref:DUF6179 domain-containing protein n=1 Tax=Paenibacillus sp. CECT 9249 TaxID=2845385 RepID=UPI001E4675BE|nr:DUF6179 domain-containing protein [Paenibacillus sp. CECT 9249]CAH0120963.1 hypothetical protein PAE9249_03488 [Paenibacillus sp. CECT 9249]
MKPENRNAGRELAAQGHINRANLKQNQYTLSLLQEGLRTGRLLSREVFHIQNEWMNILQDLIRRYTRGESSSVAVETAEGLLTSIMYAVDAYMLRYADPEQAIAYLKTADVRQMYEGGIDAVRECFEDTKLLYKEVDRTKLDVAVEAYRLTIEESVPVFLRKYSIIFDAHHTMASIDYPLAIDDMRLQGVYYIRQYLEKLNMENRFCRLFSSQDLQHMLCNYGILCGFDYRIELFNLFELTLNNAVFSVLSGGDADQTRISAFQFERLERLFLQSDAARIESSIREGMDRLRRDLQINDPGLTEYMNRCGSGLIQRIVNAKHRNRLQPIIITEQEEKPKSILISFKEEDRMTDSRFRILVRQVMECPTTEAKVRLIRSSIHSLYDYIDLLNSDCLFGDEYDTLFQTLGEAELAILAKIVFYEELRSDTLDGSSAAIKKKTTGIEWQKHYIDYIQSVGQDRIALIDKLIRRIDYEETSLY